jgi:hypothetical protein
MDIGGIIFGMILVGLGALTLKFNMQFSNSLGTPMFVARYFGPGREYSFYKLVSLLLIILGLFFIFGLFGMIANLIFSPFRGLVRTV